LLGLKTRVTYLLFIICLTGVFCLSFNSTFKLLRQSVTVVLNEVNFDDIAEEDETEKKEIEEDSKLVSDFETLDYLYFFQSKSSLNPIESKLVSMLKNIQSPPPKF
jgi:hypothetical protein